MDDRSNKKTNESGRLSLSILNGGRRQKQMRTTCRFECSSKLHSEVVNMEQHKMIVLGNAAGNINHFIFAFQFFQQKGQQQTKTCHIMPRYRVVVADI